MYFRFVIIHLFSFCETLNPKPIKPVGHERFKKKLYNMKITAPTIIF